MAKDDLTERATSCEAESAATERAATDRVPRRKFTRSLCSLVAGAATLAPRRQAGAAGEPKELSLGYLDRFAVGEVVDFEYQGAQAFAVRLASAAEGGVGPGRSVVAFQRACPHMGCPLTRVDVAAAQLGPCVCHRSLFDLKRGGRQVYGVASQPLTRITLDIRADQVFAVGVEGLPYGAELTEANL